MKTDIPFLNTIMETETLLQSKTSPSLEDATKEQKIAALLSASFISGSRIAHRLNDFRSQMCEVLISDKNPGQKIQEIRVILLKRHLKNEDKNDAVDRGIITKEEEFVAENIGTDLDTL